MAKAKYDVGDILTWCEDGHCYVTAVIVSSYMSDYDLFIKPKGDDDFRFIRDMPEMVLCKYEVVGHIDISGMPNDEVKTHLDRAIKIAWHEYVIFYTIEAYWAAMKPCESKFEKENDRLKRENERLKEEFGSASNKIFGLKREIDSLRNGYDDTEARISRNLHNLGFTSDAVYKIMYSD